MAATLDDIIQKADASLNMIPTWIQTGVPLNIKSTNHRALWLENTQQIKDLAENIRAFTQKTYITAEHRIAEEHLVSNTIRIVNSNIDMNFSFLCFLNGVLLPPSSTTVTPELTLIIINDTLATPVIIDDNITIFHIPMKRSKPIRK